MWAGRSTFSPDLRRHPQVVDVCGRVRSPDAITGLASRESSISHDAWESAYRRFETPEEETRKFLRRLKRAGALNWPRDCAIVELFSGRGSGLRALARLGFRRVTGIDLSPRLVAESIDRGKVAVGDCRQLPYASFSQDIAVIHGGLHHLVRIPEDLDLTLAEVSRVLREGGLLVVVEPWQTLFLAIAHWLGSSRLAGRLSGKIAAFGFMVANEGEPYRRWLASPQLVLDCLSSFFGPEQSRVAWGKLMFVGRKKSNGDALTAKADPVLARLWDNPEDSLYDNL